MGFQFDSVDCCIFFFFVPRSCCYYYHSSAVQLEIGTGDTSSKQFFCYSELFKLSCFFCVCVFLYEAENGPSVICEKLS